MACRTLNTNPTSNNMARRKRQVEPLEEASFGFIIADVENLLMWSRDNNVKIELFPDPEYFIFKEETVNFDNVIIIQVRLQQHDLYDFIVKLKYFSTLDEIIQIIVNFAVRLLM